MPPRVHLVTVAGVVAVVVVVEGDDEKEGVKEGDRDGTTKQANETERVTLVRLYYQSIHGKVIDKLAQFSSLKELRLGEDCSKYGTGNGDGGSLIPFGYGGG